MYVGEDVVFVFDDSSSLTNRYLYGNVVDQIFADETATEVLWALTDNQGSVRDVLNYDPTQDESTVLNHREFESCGNITAESNGSINFRYAYTGRYFDEDTGLQYNRARWYDATVGRWISEDPIGFAAGDANISRYVGNSPTNYTDPSGLDPDPPPLDPPQAVALKAPPHAPFHGDPPVVRGRTLSLWERFGRPVNSTGGPDWLDRNYNPRFHDRDWIGKTISWTGEIASTLPIAGEIGDAGQLLLGVDLQGKPLTPLEKGLTIGAAMIPFVPGSVLRKGGKEVVGAVAKHGDKAADVGKTVTKRAGDIAGAGRPVVTTSLSSKVTHELPAGQIRNSAETAQARNFYKKHRDEAKGWYSERTGKPWPENATHFEHPRAIADGGDPLFVVPGFGGPNAAHQVPMPEYGGLTDAQRWGGRGGRPRRR